MGIITGLFKIYKDIRIMKGFRLSLYALAVGTLLSSSLAHAAAFQLYEVGAPINGTATVGQAAETKDASIAYYNPAGMTHIQGTQFLLGAQNTLQYTNFSPNASTTIAGSNGANAGGLLPGLGAFFVYGATPSLKLGLSLTTPYGGALSYQNHWVGRYNVQQMMFYTVNLNPSIAYQINRWASVGAGISVEYANLYQTVAIPVSASPPFDGQATLKLDSAAPGANLGMLFTPSPNTNIGIAYRTQIIHNLRGNTNFANIATTPSTTSRMVMPSNIIASITQNVSPKATLLGEVGWANWSSMRNMVITIQGITADIPQDWSNTYRLGVGGQYKATPDFLLQAGVSYDSSPTSSSKRLPVLPMDRQIRVGLGIEYAMVRAATLGLSYEYINLGSAPINNTNAIGTLSGNYSRNYTNVFQASVNIGC